MPKPAHPIAFALAFVPAFSSALAHANDSYVELGRFQAELGSRQVSGDLSGVSAGLRLDVGPQWLIVGNYHDWRGAVDVLNTPWQLNVDLRESEIGAGYRIARDQTSSVTLAMGARRDTLTTASSSGSETTVDKGQFIAIELRQAFGASFAIEGHAYRARLDLDPDEAYLNRYHLRLIAPLNTAWALSAGWFRETDSASSSNGYQIAVRYRFRDSPVER